MVDLSPVVAPPRRPGGHIGVSGACPGPVFSGRIFAFVGAEAGQIGGHRKDIRLWACSAIYFSFSLLSNDGEEGFLTITVLGISSNQLCASDLFRSVFIEGILLLLRLPVERSVQPKPTLAFGYISTVQIRRY